MAELGRNQSRLVAFAAIVVGLIALGVAPAFDNRQDVSDQKDFFIGGVAILAIVLGAYAVFLSADRKKTSEYLGAGGTLFAAAGLIAAICGLLTLPLWTYKFAFAVMVAALVHGLITLVRLLIGR